MSDSVRPNRRQPTRLRHPWDSPGKNTGVGCHFLLQCMKVKSESEVAQSFLTLSNPMVCSLPVSSVHGIFQARVLSGVPLPSPLYMVGVRKKRPSCGKCGSPCITICAWLSRRRQMCCVCVSKKASLCLVGIRNWPSCQMLTRAASVTDVLLFRDSFCGI